MGIVTEKMVLYIFQYYTEYSRYTFHISNSHLYSASECRICEVVHASIQLCSKQSCPEKTPTTWGEGGLFIEHLTVHIWTRDCMGCDVWLSLYRHVIAWAVTSDCPHMDTSLHGLWHLTVHIWTRHCMSCEIWLSTYVHIIAWAVTSDCPHMYTSLHELWHLTVHICARHGMSCDIWLSTYVHIIAWAVTSDCPHMYTSLHELWHLTVHICARHGMSCDIWLSTYVHVIAWAVTSDCPHMCTSLHELWHLTVHICARHCMSCDIWLSTYGHVIAWRLWQKVLLLFYNSMLVVETFFKTGESVITTQRAFHSHFLLHWNDAVPDLFPDWYYS